MAYELVPGRRAYVHLVRGEADVNGMRLTGGDGAKIADETRLAIVAAGEAEVLLFDLP